MSGIALPQAHGGGDSRYTAYAYAYPHKTAYRRLEPAVRLEEAWAVEDKSALFLYTHLPFCEMRCGFCNLFTLAQPQGDLVGDYLRALETEAEKAGEGLGGAAFAQGAIGGGTPTFLSGLQLEGLFDLLGRRLKVRLGEMPLSVETSPRTASLEKMLLLKRRGVTRVSMGVQSFIESEVAAAGRAQRNVDVYSAIEQIRRAEILVLNLDLIYGLPTQTVGSWVASLRMALGAEPEELYLYPLYVRPLTGMGRRNAAIADIRAECYTVGRDLLAAAGYTQVSMRMFRKAGAARLAGPVYCCQDDGMVGIGCGARSYTRGLHYSREFAVGRESVKSILQDYISRPAAAFEFIDYGCYLDEQEQRRRYVIKSILRTDGLCVADYRGCFGTDPFEDVPELRGLVGENFLALDSARAFLRPTQKGVDYSDEIGPRLFSPQMVHAMEEFQLT